MMMTTSMAMGPGASDIVRTACAAVLARPDARWTAERLAAALGLAPAIDVAADGQRGAVDGQDQPVQRVGIGLGPGLERPEEPEFPEVG